MNILHFFNTIGLHDGSPKEFLHKRDKQGLQNDRVLGGELRPLGNPETLKTWILDILAF